METLAEKTMREAGEATAVIMDVIEKMDLSMAAVLEIPKTLDNRIKYELRERGTKFNMEKPQA